MTADGKEDVGYASWSVLELMGHRRLGGFVREQELAGQKFLRIDIPASGTRPKMTQFYGGGSVYCLTPCSEELARAAAAAADPEPVHTWELPRQLAGPAAHATDDDEPL